MRANYSISNIHPFEDRATTQYVNIQDHLFFRFNEVQDNILNAYVNQHYPFPSDS